MFVEVHHCVCYLFLVVTGFTCVFIVLCCSLLFFDWRRLLQVGSLATLFVISFLMLLQPLYLLGECIQCKPLWPAVCRCSRSRRPCRCVMRRRIMDDMLYVSRLIALLSAGSERISLSGVTGVAKQETVAINQSLSSLGNVIRALCEQKKPTYRDSK